jgi:hypothetical protein
MSSINPNNIDGTYPIAGQDNDSQGFRDNFTNIKNNFTFSKTEIEDLQNNAILKTALSGTTLDNNLNNAQLYGAQIRKFTETREDLGTQVGSVPISWNDAHFQTLAITGNTTISLSGWPTSGFWTYLVLDVRPSTENLRLTLPTAVDVNTSNIQGFSGNVSQNSITLPTGNVTYRFEFSTYNGGTNIAIRDLFRNYDTPIDFTTLNATTVNATGNVLATGLSVFGNARIGLAGVSGGQFHSVIGNITQTSSGGAVYFNTTGNVLAASVSAGQINTTGNVLAAGGVLNELTVNGNISFSGTHVETGYQQIKTGANVANVSISPTVTRVLLHPPAATVSFGANLILPNTQVDGTIISISSNVTMASLSVITPWSGTSVSPTGNAVSVVPGTVSRYMYIAADKVWYKIA